jgi:hypothetical protein
MDPAQTAITKIIPESSSFPIYQLSIDFLST